MISMPVRLALWRAALIFVGLNLAWEIAQLPLYTIWWTDLGPRIGFAVLHCTAGDLMIGAASLAAALLFAGRGWPEDCAARIRVVALTTLFGVGYTVFSEWLNVSARGSWAYTEWMPVLPPFGTGLTPILQWLILPGLTMHCAQAIPARRPTIQRARSPKSPQQPQ
jgi:hypothetical protein